MKEVIITGTCVRVNQVIYKQKINKKAFVSSIINCSIVLTFFLSLFNILEICFGKII